MTTCDVCKRTPTDGQFWSVVLNRENHHPPNSIAVLLSDWALAICLGCHPAYEKRALLELALRALLQSESERSRDALAEIEEP